MSLQSPLGSQPLSHEVEGPAEHVSPATRDAVTPATQDKPIRLALACNQCRKRKVRCDAQHPKCRNCSIRGDVCETSDPRKPGNFPAVRRWATRCCLKARGGIAKTLSHSPAHHSISALGPAALNPINAVLNPAGPDSSSLVDQSSPNARRSLRSSAVAGSSASPATPSWRTTQSDRLGEDHFSWQSRAYQEEADAAEEARVVTPEEDVNTDDNTNDRTKVRYQLFSYWGFEVLLLIYVCSIWARVAYNVSSILSIYTWNGMVSLMSPLYSNTACYILRSFQCLSCPD